MQGAVLINGAGGAYQSVEDVSLVEVGGDQGLKLCAVNLGEWFGGHVNESGQHLLEVVVSGLHDPFVRARVFECFSRVCRPNDLDAKQSNLKHQGRN